MTAAVHSTRSKSNGTFDSVLSDRLFLVLTDLLIGCLAYLAAWLVRIYLRVPFTQELISTTRLLVVSHPWIVLVFAQLFFPYLMGLYDDLRQVRKRELVAVTFIACVMQVSLVTSILFFLNPQAPGETGGIFPRTVIVLFGGFNFRWSVGMAGLSSKSCSPADSSYSGGGQALWSCQRTSGECGTEPGG